jgi:hypothetical protein
MSLQSILITILSFMLRKGLVIKILVVLLLIGLISEAYNVNGKGTPLAATQALPVTKDNNNMQWFFIVGNHTSIHN